jgi:hypothetical protein
MIHLYARILLALGLFGMLCSGGKLALIGLTHGASPQPTYYALPEGPAHVRGCRWADWTRTDLRRLAGPRAAERRGLCEACCLKGESRPDTASARSRLPSPAGTERGRKSIAGP